MNQVDESVPIALAYSQPDDFEAFRRTVFRSLAIVGLLVGLMRVLYAWTSAASWLVFVLPLFSQKYPPFLNARFLVVSISGIGNLVLGVLLAGASIRLLVGQRRAFNWMKWNELLALAMYLGMDADSVAIYFSNPASMFRGGGLGLYTVLGTSLIGNVFFPLLVTLLFRLKA